jgi:integrase/recombinase XerD
MPRVSKLQLSFDQWPGEDRRRWSEAFQPVDLFDEHKGGAHLAAATRQALRVSYSEYLRFVAEKYPALLQKPPEQRIDRAKLAEYAAILKRTRGDSSIATSLHHLRMALRLICPMEDWSWLLIVAKRIAACAPHKPKRYSSVSSDQLYRIGLDLMNKAIVLSQEQQKVSKTTAIQYRNGLLIAMVAATGMRRRTVTAPRIGGQLVKSGELWTLEFPAEDVKGTRPLELYISRELSVRIDIYIREFRVCLPGANAHDGLWPSNKGGPMTGNAIYDAIYKRTKEALGFGVNLHKFRHASGTLWSIEDPANIRGVKDFLGHSSFEKTTEPHYVMSQSRVAGRTLAAAIDNLTGSGLRDRVG